MSNHPPSFSNSSHKPCKAPFRESPLCTLSHPRASWPLKPTKKGPWWRQKKPKTVEPNPSHTSLSATLILKITPKFEINVANPVCYIENVATYDLAAHFKNDTLFKMNFDFTRSLRINVANPVCYIDIFVRSLFQIQCSPQALTDDRWVCWVCWVWHLRINVASLIVWVWHLKINVANGVCYIEISDSEPWLHRNQKFWGLTTSILQKNSVDYIDFGDFWWLTTSILVTLDGWLHRFLKKWMLTTSILMMLVALDGWLHRFWWLWMIDYIDFGDFGWLTTSILVTLDGRLHRFWWLWMVDYIYFGDFWWLTTLIFFYTLLTAQNTLQMSLCHFLTLIV